MGFSHGSCLAAIPLLRSSTDSSPARFKLAVFLSAGMALVMRRWSTAKCACFMALGGHFLDEAPVLFDAPFFSITSAEAAPMDVQ